MNNKVELLGFYGSDEIVACSAWTSTSRDLTEEKRARIPAMIKSLWKEGHHTPMEKAQVHFLVTTDIASHIHLLKHRISSLNGESARYKELKEDKFYLPEDWKEIKANTDILKINDKQSTWLELLEQYTRIGNDLYHDCLKDLTPILGRKRAKESARFFKTYNSQLEADVMFNMRSFANFQKLRNSEHAQLEIKEIAQQMLDLLKGIEGNPFKTILECIDPNKEVVKEYKVPEGWEPNMFKDYVSLARDTKRVFLTEDNKHWIVSNAEGGYLDVIKFSKEQYNRAEAIRRFRKEIYNENYNN